MTQILAYQDFEVPDADCSAGAQLQQAQSDNSAHDAAPARYEHNLSYGEAIVENAASARKSAGTGVRDVLPPLSYRHRKSVPALSAKSAASAEPDLAKFYAARQMSEVLTQRRNEQIRRREAELAVLEQIERENEICAEKEKAERLMRYRDEERQRLRQKQQEREKLEQLREQQPPDVVKSSLKQWKQKQQMSVEQQKEAEAYALAILEQKRERYRLAEEKLKQMRSKPRPQEEVAEAPEAYKALKDSKTAKADYTGKSDKITKAAKSGSISQASYLKQDIPQQKPTADKPKAKPYQKVAQNKEQNAAQAKKPQHSVETKAKPAPGTTKTTYKPQQQK